MLFNALEFYHVGSNKTFTRLTEHHGSFDSIKKYGADKNDTIAQKIFWNEKKISQKYITSRLLKMSYEKMFQKLCYYRNETLYII